jgi:hypothetical protein
MSVLELYNQSIRSLPSTERLRLATLILSDIAPPLPGVRWDWSQEDLGDFQRSTWEHISQTLREDQHA